MKLDFLIPKQEDYQEVFRIFRSITAKGDSFIYPDNLTDEEITRYWLSDYPFIVKLGDKIIATCVIRPNKIGRASHICNAGFMVDPEYQGNGYGRKIAEYALKKAKELGYIAMQFNVVVSTNKRAVSLWESIGFNRIATIEKGFNHKDLGLVDCYIMYKSLHP